MSTVKVKGEEIELGGQIYILPPCPLVKMSEATIVFRGATDATDPKYAKGLCDVIYWSLLRNYPDMKESDVTDNVDMANFGDVTAAMMKVNKLVRTDTNGAATGEVQAVK